MAGYERIGYVLGFVGGILMIILPILNLLDISFNVPGEGYIGYNISGNEIVSAAIIILFGVIILGLIGTGPLRVSKDPSELLVGILLIVFGYLGGTLGGILALIGGIFYIIEEATT